MILLLIYIEFMETSEKIRVPDGICYFIFNIINLSLKKFLDNLTY